MATLLFVRQPSYQERFAMFDINHHAAEKRFTVEIREALAMARTRDNFSDGSF